VNTKPIQNTGLPIVLLVIIGVFLWFPAQVLAFGLAGAGHGWVIPLFITMPLILLYPLAMIAAFRKSESSFIVGMIVFFFAISLNGILIKSSLDESRYFKNIWNNDPYICLCWIVFWLGWQVPAVYALFKKSSKSNP
jgi:hypothetical protein